MALLEWSNKNEGSHYEAVKLLVKTLPSAATADALGELLEDSI
jgi:hypothetical protein